MMRAVCSAFCKAVKMIFKSLARLLRGIIYFTGGACLPSMCIL